MGLYILWGDFLVPITTITGISGHNCSSMAMTQEPIDWRYLPYIFGLNLREYSNRIWSYMVRLRTSIQSNPEIPIV